MLCKACNATADVGMYLHCLFHSSHSSGVYCSLQQPRPPVLNSLPPQICTVIKYWL